MAQSENYNFEVDGVNFYAIWKSPNSSCLLRSIDHLGLHQTCLDLFSQLHNGTSNYSLSKEEAFAKAPIIAKQLLERQRIEELQYMERIFTDKSLREQYPAYKIFLINKTPVVWASHMGYIYIKKPNWEYIAWAKTQNETIKIVEEKTSTQTQKKSFLERIGFKKKKRIVKEEISTNNAEINVQTETDKNNYDYWIDINKFWENFFPANKDIAELFDITSALKNNANEINKEVEDFIEKGNYDSLAIEFKDNESIIGTVYLLFSNYSDSIKENHKKLTGLNYDKQDHEELAISLLGPLATTFQSLFDLSPTIGQKQCISKEEFNNRYKNKKLLNKKPSYLSLFTWDFKDNSESISYYFAMDIELLKYLKTKDEKLRKGETSYIIESVEMFKNDSSDIMLQMKQTKSDLQKSPQEETTKEVELSEAELESKQFYENLDLNKYYIYTEKGGMYFTRVEFIARVNIIEINCEDTHVFLKLKVDKIISDEAGCGFKPGKEFTASAKYNYTKIFSIKEDCNSNIENYE